MLALGGGAAAAALSGCTGLLNAVAPAGGLRIARGLPYGPGPRHRIDVYAPDDARGAPCVLFLYGGGWRQGDRATYRFAATALGRRGIVTFVADYRLYPEVTYPAFLDDCAAAFAWARVHAAEYGGNPARLCVMGHSAGAYNALMLALDRSLLPEPPAAAIGLAGPYDFLPMRDLDVREVFAGAVDSPATQPITYVTPASPPLLLLTGTSDTTVRPGNTERLAAKAKAAGVPVQTIEYKGVGHIGLVAALAAPLQFIAPVLRDTTRYIRRVGAA